jgi:hypothetical protein
MSEADSDHDAGERQSERLNPESHPGDYERGLAAEIVSMLPPRRAEALRVLALAQKIMDLEAGQPGAGEQPGN